MLKSKIIAPVKPLWTAVQAHRGEIIYYGCVLAALTLIACGAEAYRAGKTAPEAVALPAVEISAQEPQPPQFLLPEGMSLLRGYSAEPVWNESDASWQAHPAADYACADGNVHAIAAGTVVTVGRSGVLGGFAEVQSGDVLLRYCCIRPGEEIQPGAQLKQGACIGTAQNAMPGESQLGAHLHLEALQGGSGVDPQTLIQSAD